MSTATSNSAPPASERRPAVEKNSPSERPSGNGSAEQADKSLSESEYLQREAHCARDALQRSLSHLQASLSDAADLRLWTRKYPWAAIGIAAATGFTAAAVAVPSKTPPDAKQSSRGGAAKRSAARRGEETGSSQQPQGAPAVAATLIASLFDLAKTAIEKSIRASADVAAARAAPANAPDGEEAQQRPQAACH